MDEKQKYVGQNVHKCEVTLIIWATLKNVFVSYSTLRIS